MSIPVALTIAGSDSGGGAGIQADLKTFHAFGVFGTSAVTAVTVQNTLGVQAVHTVPVEIVRAQIEAVCVDLAPRACKTGMLATAELVVAVAAAIRENNLQNFVLDPVMVSTSGDRLLTDGAENAVIGELMPLCAVVTPNLDEAAVMLGHAVADADAMEDAARELARLGARAVLLKGGHLPGDVVVDVFFDGTVAHTFRRPRIDTKHTHGTGCTLSAAIVAGLAQGRPLHRAVTSGLDYVHAAIESAPNLGRGSGPLNHFVPLPQSQD